MPLGLLRQDMGKSEEVLRATGQASLVTEHALVYSFRCRAINILVVRDYPIIILVVCGKLFSCVSSVLTFGEM